MEKLINLAAGVCRLEISGVSPEKLINRMAESGVRFWDSERVDALTVHISVPMGDVIRVEAMAVRCGCTVTPLGQYGLPKLKRRMKRRWALLICAVALFSALMTSSFFLWDIEVTGNERVSTGEILRALEECGVGVGAYWPGFKADLIRNAVILKLPELRWLAVNVDSSRAYVIVRERTEKPELLNEAVAHDVRARQTGIIESVSALEGTPLVTKGQAVMAGETLITGARSSELTEERFVHAKGTVIARTYRTISVAAPLEYLEKAPEGASRSRWAIRFGDKRFNFYISSSKMGIGCDKIIREYPLAVPGVFTLPLTLVQERQTEYNTVSREIDRDALRAELETQLTAALEKALAGRGEAVAHSFAETLSGGALTITLRAECLEDIAEEVPIAP